MKVKLLIIALFLCLVANAEKPFVKWAKSVNGLSDDYVGSIAIDKDGDVFFAGSYSSATILFGSIQLTNSGVDTQDFFLAKYNSSGILLWAKSFGSNDNFDNCQTISTDSLGNVYMSGSFRSLFVKFDAAVISNSCSPASTGYLAKINQNGVVLWAKSSGTNTYISNSISANCNDSKNNLLTTGTFQDTSITFGSIVLYNSSYLNQDIFVTKYNPEGEVIWAKKVGGTNHDATYSITTDINDDIYITGYFTSPVLDYGTGTLYNTNSPSTDLFIIKYDSNGNVLWAKSAGGDSSDTGLAVTVDNNRNVYLGGNFKSSSITFGNTTLTNLDTNYSKSFLVKYDLSGNIIWAKGTSGSNKNDIINSLATDKAGNIYSTGYFDGATITFDTITLTNANTYQDIFMTKYNTNGDIQWAKRIGGIGNDYGKTIRTDANGYVYLAGQLGHTLVIDSITLTNNSFSSDMFVAKFRLMKSSLFAKDINYCASDSLLTIIANDGYSSYNWVDKNGNTVGNSRELELKRPSNKTIYLCKMTLPDRLDTLQVTIMMYDPKADFDFQSNCSSNVVSFFNKSTKTQGNLSYKWDFGDGTNSADENPQHTFSKSGSYQVSLQALNPPSSCESKTTKNVQAFEPVSIKLDGDLTFCSGYSTTLKVSGASKYKWSNNSTLDSCIFKSAEKIWILGYSNSGCISDTIFRIITEEPDWTLSIEGNTIICNDSSTNINAIGAERYRWNTGQTTSSIIATSPGKYTVSGINKRGCEKSTSIDVYLDAQPRVDFSISQSSISTHSSEISCTVHSISDVDYSWEMGDGTLLTGSSIKHNYQIENSVKEYAITLTATTKHGCVYKNTKSIDIVPFVPNVFTPNNDGINDLFMPNYDLKIMDRYGIELYKGKNGWDGTYNGKKVDPDSYFYMILYKDNNQREIILKGFVDLIR